MHYEKFYCMPHRLGAKSHFSRSEPNKECCHFTDAGDDPSCVGAIQLIDGRPRYLLTIYAMEDLRGSVTFHI